MKIRVLGCSGAIARDCRTTSFLVDDDVLVDAGTGVGDLPLEDMARIGHVFLTHSHLDHIAALPLMLDAVGARRSTPLQVHALPATIASGVYTIRGFLHTVFRILCGKQTVTDRQNSIAIRPAQRQHAEAVGVDMLGVVKNLGEEFYFLRAGTAVYGVIYDEHIKSVFAGKRFDGLLDDS